MRIARSIMVAAALLGAGAGVALAEADGNSLVHSREFGGQVYMMNETHMSLYFFDKDEPNVSNCYDQCAVNWPPLILDADAELGENYSLIKRRDGTMQAAYKGQPLYLFAGDKEIGDINGDGVKGIWRLAKP